MEPYIADLINNPKIPKILRYIIVSVWCLFIIFLGVNCAISSPFVFGKIFGITLSIVFLIIGIYLYNKISKSKKSNDIN